MAERGNPWQYAFSILALVFALTQFANVTRGQVWGIVPDAPSYAMLAENLAGGDGYVIERELLPNEPEGSRYPPGTALMLAPVTWLADVGIASLVLTLLFVAVAWWTACALGGPVAAGIAVLLLVESDPMRAAAETVLADIPAALLTLLALRALLAGRHRLAGVLAALSVWTRLAMAPIGFGLPRRAVMPFLIMIGLLALTKVAWGWGYRSDEVGWSLEFLWSRDALAREHTGLPNVLAYPAMLLGIRGSLIFPGAIIAAAVGVWRRSERRFVLSVVFGSLAVYLPYFWQDDRFMFPAVALVAVYAGAGVAAAFGSGGCARAGVAEVVDVPVALPRPAAVPHPANARPTGSAPLT